MDVGIGTVEITEGSLETVGAGFKNEPLMPARSSGCNCETKFKGHIESWCAGKELNAAQIMKRIAARL